MTHEMTEAVAEVVDGSRVFFQLGNYQFEVVIPIVIAPYEDAAQSTADLVTRQLAEWKARP